MTTQTDYICAFNAIATDVHNTAVEKGWWDCISPEDFFYNNYGSTHEVVSLPAGEMIEAYKAGQQNPPPNQAEKLMLIVSEVVEAMEGIRKDLDSDHIPGFKMIEEELADVQIRIKDFAKKFGYRVAEAEIAKIEFNKTRTYRHGNKKF